MKLVIVESPTKAKKINQFLDKDFESISSKGHIRDLPKSELGVDVENGFKPKYVVIHGKARWLKKLKREAKRAEKIYLATDPDREGEAIAWHVASAIEGLDLNDQLEESKFPRVVFHEITKEAILEAFSNPRSLDFNLVDAQKARRILDRLVGYKLSPLLWKKIRYGLSAGRVQSVGVRLIVEREREREAFQLEKFYRIWAKLVMQGLDEAELVAKDGVLYEKRETKKLFAGDYTVSNTSIKSKDEALELIEDIKQYPFIVETVTRKEVKERAFPPFTTASMQRGGVNRLGFSSRQTMRLAQRLYEEGFITYHRTDSTTLAPSFVEMVRSYVEKTFGKQFVPKVAIHYQTKVKSAQEAHEAIRPTSLVDGEKQKLEIQRRLGRDEARLYELIRQRAVSCQMTPAIFDQLTVRVKAGPYEFRVSGRDLKFIGWRKVYDRNRDQPVSVVLLPEVEEGDELKLEEVFYSGHTTSTPPRYTEASLIRDLEKHDIGRPSTYAPIIYTIQERGYVGKDGKYFYPEDTGLVVNDLLVKHFPDIVDLGFTAEMEEDLDRIARGEKNWVKVLEAFYDPFEKLLNRKLKEIDKEDVVVMGETDRKCPECGHGLVIKLGKYGRFISCSNFPECDYAEFLDDVHTPENEAEVDKEQLEGKCPQCKGELELKTGKYGRFIACKNYPECKFTKNYLEKIGMKCPECGEGEVIIKRTRKGRTFYGCSRYPQCKYASWQNPSQKEPASTQ